MSSNEQLEAEATWLRRQASIEDEIADEKSARAYRRAAGHLQEILDGKQPADWANNRGGHWEDYVDEYGYS